MNPLLVFSFCRKDIPAADRSSELIAQFGPYPKVHLLIQPTKDVDAGDVKRIETRLEGLFASARTEPPFDDAPQIWPEGPNHMFRRAAKWVMDSQFDYFYFWEPDCLPLKQGWLDALCAEYEASGLPFLGVIHDTRLRNAEGEEYQDGVHMVGTGFYHKQTPVLASSSVTSSQLAWDVAAQRQIVPQCHPTKKIQHNWSTQKYTSLDQLGPDAFVHHGCKDDSLYKLLTGQTQSDPEPKPIEEIHPRICQTELPSVEAVGDLPSAYDTVMPHVISLLQAICKDAATRRKVQRVLRKECLVS